MNSTEAPAFPAPEDSDSEQVALYLETGHALWTKGDTSEAARWLRRAVEAAEEEGNDMRSLQLARAAADIRGSIGASLPPPLPSSPSPVVSENRDRSHSGLAPVPPALPEMPSSPLRSRPPPKPPSMKPPSGDEASATTTPVGQPLASRPPPPSARASMPPAPSARASMTPQPPAAAPTASPSSPSSPSPTTVSSSSAARASIRPAAPANRASVVPSKPSASMQPPVKPAPSAPRAQAALDDLTTSAQLQSLLAQGRAVRVSVKRSARDDSLYVIRKIVAGKPLPHGAREAILVLPEVDPEF